MEAMARFTLSVEMLASENPEIEAGVREILGLTEEDPLVIDDCIENFEVAEIAFLVCDSGFHLNKCPPKVTCP